MYTVFDYTCTLIEKWSLGSHAVYDSLGSHGIKGIALQSVIDPSSFDEGTDNCHGRYGMDAIHLPVQYPSSLSLSGF